MKVKVCWNKEFGYKNTMIRLIHSHFVTSVKQPPKKTVNIRRCMAVKVTAKKEFTLEANDQVEVSTFSCRSLPKMLRAFNQRNAVFEVLLRKI